MPPKAPPKAKKTEGPSKKTEGKKKEKIIEDKTFGLKNKKGNKQQKFIKMVTTQVQHGNRSARQTELLKEQLDKNKKKDDKKLEQLELNLLFRPVEQKIAKGVDPKSILCAFFKQGTCKKGEKCKFSHDMTIGRKAEKRNLYEDKAENMADWDEAKLEEVVNQKHGEENKALPKTTIICRYFLDAVENSKYGWFWDCPGGTKCHYKHALPPGFVLKKDKKKDDSENQVTIEELVERERAALGHNVTKVTLVTFLKWKERKRRERMDYTVKADVKKRTDYKAGKMHGLSGRDMFTFNPTMITEEDDEDGGEVVSYCREDDEDRAGSAAELNLEELAQQAREVDDSGTVSTSIDRLGDTSTSLANGTTSSEDDESSKLSMAAALPPDDEKATNDAISAALAATVDGGDLLAEGIQIDENLFDGEDLDLIDEDLETLELDD